MAAVAFAARPKALNQGIIFRSLPAGLEKSWCRLMSRMVRTAASSGELLPFVALINSPVPSLLLRKCGLCEMKCPPAMCESCRDADRFSGNRRKSVFGVRGESRVVRQCQRYRHHLLTPPSPLLGYTHCRSLWHKPPRHFFLPAPMPPSLPFLGPALAPPLAPPPLAGSGSCATGQASP